MKRNEIWLLKSPIRYQHHGIVIVGVLLILSQMSPATAYGVDNTNTGISSYFLENWTPKFDMTTRGAFYPADSNLEPVHWHLSGNIAVQVSKSLGDRALLVIEPKVNFDTAVSSKGVHLFVEDQEERPVLTLHEAFVAWYGSTVEIEVGKRIYSWKIADTFSPVDSLNPVDVIELVNTEKIGVPLVSVVKWFELATIQAVWLPVFVPNRQPPDTFRWTGGSTLVSEYDIDTVSVRELPDNWFEKTSVAFRISSSTLLSGWDLAAIYRYGYSTQGVNRDELAPDLLTVYQTTEYPAYNLYGFTFSTTWGDLECHGEAAATDTRDNVKNDDYLSYIVGINYVNHDWMTHLFDEIRFIAEYAGEAVLKERDSDSPYSSSSLTRGLTSNIIATMDFKMNEDNSVKLSYCYNIDEDDSMLELSATSRLNDHLEMFYGYQQLSGDDTTFFGQWNDNDRIFVEISVTY